MICKNKKLPINEEYTFWKKKSKNYGVCGLTKEETHVAPFSSRCLGVP